MKKAIAEKWVKALRSGKYKQGTGYLRTSQDNSNSFCCLGVLCNIHAQEHPELAKKETNPDVYMGETEFLPEKVMKWAGMDDSGGVRTDREGIEILDNEFFSLAEANDYGISFTRIATWIEKNYEKL